MSHFWRTFTESCYTVLTITKVICIVLHIARFPAERIGKLSILETKFPQENNVTSNKNKNMLCMEEFVMSVYVQYDRF